MWNNTIRVLIVFAALVTLNKAQRNEYLPPNAQSNEYLPPDNGYNYPTPDDPVNIGDANSDSSVFIKPEVPLQDPTIDGASAEHHDHGHDHDHDHHHEHWDLRESIPGEPGQDYPLHYSVPDTGFSCAGRTAGYYADIQAGCQAFHVCPEDEALPPQSFLCPNGSIFNQEVFACDWWNNVDCAGSETHYVRNNEIGVVGTSNTNKVPVRLKQQNNQELEGNDNINFQSQSSNDVEDSRQYLPPVNNDRKPIVTEYNGPPPVQVTTRAPVTVARTQRPTAARTQSTPDFRPVTERNYLPPVQENNRPVQQQVAVQRTTTQRPIQRVTQSARRPTTVQNEYLPPASTPTRNVVQQTYNQQTSQRVQPQPVTTSRPVQRVNQRPTQSPNTYIAPARQQTITPRPQIQQTQQAYSRPVQQFVQSTTARPFLPIRVAEPAANQNFNLEGYKYNKPSINLETPNFDNKPDNSYLPPQTVNIAVSTPRPVQTFSATPRPVSVSQTFAPVRQTPAPVTFQPVRQTPAPVTFQPVRQTPASVTFQPVRQTSAPVRQSVNLNQRPTFTQTDGYNYPKPAVGLPAPSTTRAPVRQTPTPVRQTFAPVRQTPAPVQQTFAPVRQTPAPVQQTFAPVRQTPAPQRPSFSQTDGYNYPKPAVGLPAPSTTRAPVRQTFAPVTQAPVRQTFAPVTQPPVRQTPVQQTFAPVRQTPVQQTFAPVRQTPAPQRPSFSQTEGYNYPKPAVGFPAPSTTRAPVRQTFAPVTQAPVRQTFAPVTQAPVRQTFAPVTQAPVRQTFAPVTQPPVRQTPVQQTFAPVRQTPAPQRPSFSQTEGYNYPKPAVGLPAPSTTRAPVRQTFAPVTQAPVRQTPVQQTFAPVRQTPAPVQQTFAPVRQTPAPQRPSFSQTEGYSYPKPAVGLPAPSTTRAPVRQTFAPVTQAPVRQTFAPVVQTTQRPVVTTTRQPFVTQAFNKVDGYSYSRPAVAFELPVANKAASSSQQSNAQTIFTSQNGFSSLPSITNKPAGFSKATISAQTISTTLRPQTSFNDQSIAIQQNYQILSVKNQNTQQSNQGYQYNLPAAAKAQPAPFSVKATQTSSYIAPTQPSHVAVQPQFQQAVNGQQHTTCIHAQNAQFDNSQTSFVAKGVSQEYLPPVESQNVVSQQSQQSNNEFEGYSYPKPKTPFITPNNPTLQLSSSSFQSSQNNNNQFSQASFQRQNSRNIGEESFIQGFNAAAGNFQHQQDVSITHEHESFQQHNNGQGSQSFSSGARAASSSDSAPHQIDIVPSISFSYQLDQEGNNAKSSNMNYRK